jgi:hypothetical protein
MIQEALEEARRLAHDNRLEGKDLDELAELEDEEDEEFLNSYRYANPHLEGMDRALTFLLDRNEWRSCRHEILRLCTTRFTHYKSRTTRAK